LQEYHFGSREWNIIETSGYPVKGGYGHSAVLDELTNKIYVYGGYVSSSSSAAQLTSSLYSFDHLAARCCRLNINVVSPRIRSDPELFG
jgi:hypothetical protein